MSADHFYLERAEQTKLLSILREIPSLAFDLGITITKQDRVGTQVRIKRQRKQSESNPMNFDAVRVADELHNALTTWVRAVCEQREMEVPAIDTTPKLARWLDRYIIALAMTEGSETALDDIGDPFDKAKTMVCPPAQRVVIDAGKLADAEKAELNSNGIATVAKELDERYRHLTRKRVNNLHQLGHITPVRHFGATPIYRLGDVLVAHLKVPNRPRTEGREGDVV